MLLNPRQTLRRLLPLLIAAVLLAGCNSVRRRITIRSNPPGAQVYIDNYEIGRTPVSTDFTYYGARRVRLVKDGYETLVVDTPVNAPWYQYPGLDFVSENLWPWKIRDERTFDYTMQPQAAVPSGSLLTRAEELRLSNRTTPQNVAPQPVAVPVQPAPATLPPGGYVPPPVMLNYGPAREPVVQPADPTAPYGGRPVAPLP